MWLNYYYYIDLTVRSSLVEEVGQLSLERQFTGGRRREIGIVNNLMISSEKESSGTGSRYGSESSEYVCQKLLMLTVFDNWTAWNKMKRTAKNKVKNFIDVIDRERWMTCVCRLSLYIIKSCAAVYACPFVCAASQMSHNSRSFPSSGKSEIYFSCLKPAACQHHRTDFINGFTTAFAVLHLVTLARWLPP